MRKKKVKLFAGALFLIVLVLTLTQAAFQIGTRFYIDAQVQKEMLWQMEQLEKRMLEGDAYTYVHPGQDSLDVVFSLINKDFNQLIPITMIGVNTTKCQEILLEGGMENSEILRYFTQHPEMVEEETCRKVEINGMTNYLMVRNYIYKGREHGRVEFMAIFVAAPEELFVFVEKIQFVFVFVMFVLGVVLFIASYNIGVGFEKDKQKLTHYFQNASHELKTPIMSIQGYAEGIQTGVFSDHEKAADVIMAESDRMRDLVDEILILSKMDSGYADTTKEILNISDLLCDCMNHIYEQAKQKGIEFQVHMPEKNIQILGNEIQLERAFGNILSNALRYAKSSIRVEISREKKWVKIDIKDDGDGIPEQDLAHIFERFYKGPGGQHGIGLAITREIILLHKGRIRAYNQNGAGFIVLLKAQG